MDKLYHFCPAHMVRSIKKHGLTMGKMPLLLTDGTAFVNNVQWLTAEPDPKNQSWATHKIIRYSRTEYRLTVEISEPCLGNLMHATDYVKQFPLADERLIADWPGSEAWYVYLGQIPPHWIRKIEPMT